MKLFDFLKKILSPKKKNENTLNPDELYEIQKAFLDILSKYTSISSTIESIDENTNNKLSGLFCDKFECSLFRTYKQAYAIRFNNNMAPEEFNQVFNLLKNNMGNPNIFSEYDGYVWTQDGYVLSLGLVRLNYHYDVPMICVHKNINEFSATVDYEEYAFIADAINRPLIERNIFNHRSYYPIIFGKSFTDMKHPGYANMVMLPNSIVTVDYRNKKLELTIVPLVSSGEVDVINTKNKRAKQNAAEVKEKIKKAYPESEFKLVKNQDRHTVYALISDNSILEEKLNQFLEETKYYYETK